MEKPEKDLGFGTRSGSNIVRALNKDGSFNVNRKGQSLLDSFEPYHWLISISWKKFIFVVLLWYTAVNFIFAGMYMWAGVEHLTGVDMSSEKSKFFDAFFFSSQTLTTLGYGRIAPTGMATSTLAAVESMIGLMGFALVTGLLYGRFSRPVAKILFSNHALIAPYRGITGFMFRMVNQRRNQLIETEVEVVLSMRDKNDGANRVFQALNLERDKINFFPLSWTIVHPIDETSPLFHITEEDLKKYDIEFIVMLKAFDDTFSQMVYSRSSYSREDLVWGAKFVSMFHPDKEGHITLDIGKLDAFEKVKLDVPSFVSK